MRRIVLLSTLVLACSGCATYQDWHYSCSNYYRAYAAWHSMGKDSSPGRDHDYADGWTRGYSDVATTLIPQEDVPQVTLFGAPPRLGSPNRGFPSLPPRTTIRQVESIAQRSPQAPPAAASPVVGRL